MVVDVVDGGWWMLKESKNCEYYVILHNITEHIITLHNDIILPCKWKLMGQENALPSLNHWWRISLLIFRPRMLLCCESKAITNTP